MSFFSIRRSSKSNTFTDLSAASLLSSGRENAQPMACSPAARHCHSHHRLSHAWNRRTQKSKEGRQHPTTTERGKIQPVQRGCRTLTGLDELPVFTIKAPTRSEPSLFLCCSLKPATTIPPHTHTTSLVSVWQLARTQWWETDFPIKCS